MPGSPMIFRMKRSWMMVLALCAAYAEEPKRAIVVEGEPVVEGNAPGPELSSKSGQFRVTGGDPATRGALALLAEAARTEFRDTCGIKGDWKIPIGIRLHGKAGEPSPTRPILTRLVDVDGVRQLILEVHIGLGVDHEPFRRGIYSLLIYELALAGKTDPEDQLAAMPWLVDGLLEAAAWKHGTSERRLYRALFLSGGLFKLSDLLALSEAEHERLDGASRVAFRISSGALVTALLDQPQGKDGFRAFLKDAASFAGEVNVVLSRHFPDLNLSDTGLEKLWRLQMANKGGLNTLQDVLTVQETEDALRESLYLDFRTEEGLVQRVPLSEWRQLSRMDPAERATATRSAEDALVRLSYRCFPSYRPLLGDYQRLLSAMRGNKPGDVTEKLSELEEAREVMLARSAHGRDYLDWFEITRARETSGAFEDYRKLKQRLKHRPSERSSSTARYLDQMDRVFTRE
jgi:hypothetical protein